MKKWLTAFLMAAVLTAVVVSGILNHADQYVSDSVYQKTGAAAGNIVVVGLDQTSLDALGPLPWPRNYMAEAISFLNNADPDCRPAVIGVDVLYTGDGADPDIDRQLVNAAGQYGNVVLASAAVYGSDATADENGIYHINERSIQGFDAPFEDLAQSAAYGHVNAMSDTDGIFRHALLYIDVPEEGRVYSFSRVIYEKWCEQTGTEPQLMPHTSDHGFYYVAFTASGGSYCDGVSFIDLLDGYVEPDFYRDKIVLIGPYSPGMQDAYFTSLDHASSMYGIDINANLIDAFQKGFFPDEVDDTPQLAVLFLLCFFAAAFFWERELKQTVPVWLAICIGWTGICALAYRCGFILHILPVPVCISVLFFGTVIYNYIRVQSEKKKISYTFKHYLDPVIMNRIQDQGIEALELGGKTYHIAVLFVDIRGFTSMSESLDAQTVVEIVNRYLTLTTECIIRNHGILDKFVGDCTMAFWNAPFPQEDPVYMACCAAMDMIRESGPLCDELQEKYGRTVSFGIGVHYGPAVVGNIGAPQRLDYTAIGDTVNTASRLESNAKGSTILISRAVADKLGQRAKVTSLGNSVKLKGKSDDFEVLSLDELVR